MVCGDDDALRARLSHLVGALEPSEVLVVSDDASLPPPGVGTSGMRALARVLGRGFDAVVVDLRAVVDADALGRAEGLVRGGGALVLVLPSSPRGDPSLAVHPFAPSDVGTRFAARLTRALASSEADDVVRAPSTPLRVAERAALGTAEQAALVRELGDALGATVPVMFSLVADRGRGKSAALGLALTRALEHGPLRIAAAAASAEGLGEVLRFAPAAALTVLEPMALAAADVGAFDVIVIDEAAQLAVPLLVRIAERHRSARIAFATTCRGYEGTGRGYVLRFVEWARSSGRPLYERTLTAPIRFAAGDPLERFVRRLLLLDAEPAPVEGSARASSDGAALESAALAPLARIGLLHEQVSQDRLAEDEMLLRGAFGLLVHAHYRTTPGDLARLLDAPNLALHVLREEGRVVGSSLVAREGGFSLAHAEALARGQARIRGHALSDTLITHCQRPDAGVLSMLRSVRIATHPELRRRGLARQLVESIHAAHTVDLFGTVFGATPDLVRFRRRLGYELCRVGISRGARSGEPSVVMIRPVSAASQALVRDLRDELARELPIQLELLAVDGELELTAELAQALSLDLPEPRPLSAAETLTRVRRYVASAQPSSAAPSALMAFAEQHRSALGRLRPSERDVIEARLLARLDWATVAQRAGLSSAAAATRALRPAMAALIKRVE